MPVKKSAEGRREVESSIEIPGTPEEVWELVATGPGVSSWFVPTRTEGDDARPTQIICSFGPGMEAVAEILAWAPPRSFRAEAPWGPDMPVATEWHVEAQSGETCVVRVVHSLFSSTDDWDDQLEGTESGWRSFFTVLRLRQTHFRGLPASVAQASHMVAGSAADVWARASAGFGVAGEGAWTGPGGATGIVDRASDSEVFIVLERPTPGLLHLSAQPMGGQVMVAARRFHYGADVPAPDEAELLRTLSGI